MNGSFTLDYERTGNTYALPQNKWVLKTVEISDGVAGDGVDTMRNSFTYENGYYDRDAREFYGFAKVTSSQLNTAANDVVYRSNVQQFLNNEYYTKGLVEKEWVEDASGKKYTETTNEYRKVNVEDSVKFPSLIQTNKLFYEGNPTPGITTSTQFDYDAFGNIIQIKDNGDGSIQDMIIADITYHNPPGIYPKNSPKSIVVNTTEGIKRKRETLLDNNGNLIQIKQYLADGTAAVHDIAYDDYGNMTKITRPLNDSGKRLWYHYEYDNAVHTYITKIDDAYGYSSSSTYDYSFGGLTGTMSENDEPMRYELDNRGRLITITGPYELAAGKPYTIAFDYHPDANVPYAISHHYDPEYDSDINTVTFMDGLGRAIQVKKDISLFADSAVADQLKMSVSGKDIYDAFGRVIQNHHPVTEPIGSSNTILNTTIGVLLSDMDLDVLNRNTNTTLADGATSTKTYSIANGFFNTSTKDPLQNIKEEQTDVRERKRIINLMSGPNGTITTKFNYNALSELISVIDAGGNAIINEYDNLGRKISVKHPDAGLTEFSYDLAGNLLKKVTPQIRKEIPNGGAIEYRYEFERLTDIDYPRQYQNKVKYVYGAPGTGSKAGRLILQQDASGGQEFYYGKLGEVVKTIRTLLASDIFYTTYVSEQEYDTWNRVKKMVYPDGEVVKYHYNKAGSLYSIDGSKDGNNYQYVTQLGYDEYEQRVYLLYGNGAENKYQYDPVRRRLSNLFAETGSGRSFMNNTYSYDPVSNIKSIENNVQAVPGTLGGYAKQDFGYDNLYRLTSAAGQFKGAGDLSSYNLSMSYDNLYNITHKKIFGTPGVTSYDFAYSYAGNAPHQPDKVGTVQYKYDLNGNQVNSGNSQFFWDEENRLMAVIADGVLSRYTYDATGDRAIKSSGGIRGMWVNGAPAGLINHDTNYTAYVSPYVVCRRTGFTKHIYIESQRIATKIGIGKFRNISFGQQQSALTAGSIDYLQRFADMQRQRYAYYASLGISPGPPTDKYFYALPYNNGIAAPIFIDTSHSSVPIGWPGNTTPPILGPPIFVNPIPSNDSVKAGYGFESTGHFYEQSQYFYHPDHLGSTSYVTNIFGEVCQHQEYSAFGETFLEEHASSYTTPYLYNAKERDAETGLYYYGARYYNPVSSIWLSVDPEFDKNPGFSPYNYCLQNPVILNDPNGKSPDWGAVGKGFVKGVVVGAVGAAIVGGAIVAGTAMIAVGGAVAVAGAVVAGAGYGVAIYGAYQTGKATGEALITGTDTYSGRSLSNSERSEMGGEILGGIVGGLGAAKGMKAAMAQNSNLAGKALSLNKSVADVMGESYKAAGEKTASIKNEGLKNKLNAISKGDWVKVYEAGIKDGNKVETHYFRNNSTGEVFDVKPKYDYWHQRSFKSLE